MNNNSEWEAYQKQLYEKAYEEAHFAFLEEKATLIKELECMAEAQQNDVYIKLLHRTIKFIEHAKD